MLVLTRKANETLHYAGGKYILTVTEILPMSAVIQITGSPFDIESVRADGVDEYKDGEHACITLGETVSFGEDGQIRVKVSRVEKDAVRLASECSKDIHIKRGELL